MDEIIKTHARPKSMSGSVYALRSRIGTRDFVKVGVTRQGIKKRMAKLQTGCPGKIYPYFRLETPADDMMQIEKQLHLLLCEQHSSGEWFRWNNLASSKLWFQMCLISKDNEYDLYHFSGDVKEDPDHGGEKINSGYTLNTTYASKYKKLRGRYLYEENHARLLEEVSKGRVKT